MAVALVVMALVVGALVVRLIHKNEELKEKNDVIVREVRRNQTLIDRAVQQGVSRAAMLSFSLLLLVGSVSVLTSGGTVLRSQSTTPGVSDGFYWASPAPVWKYNYVWFKSGGGAGFSFMAQNNATICRARAVFTF